MLKQEKELMRQQCEGHQRELAAAQDFSRQQSAKIKCLEKEKIEMSSRMDQDTLCARVEATDNVIQLMKDKGDLELKCRQLKANLAGMDRSEMSGCIGHFSSEAAPYGDSGAGAPSVQNPASSSPPSGGPINRRAHSFAATDGEGGPCFKSGPTAPLICKSWSRHCFSYAIWHI